MTNAEFNLLEIEVHPIEGTNHHLITISGFEFRIRPFIEVETNMEGYDIYDGDTCDDHIDEFLERHIDFDDPDYKESYGFRNLIEYIFEHHV